MYNQLTDTLLMIRPSNFGFNHETFLSNSFQNKPEDNEAELIQKKALIEFDEFVKKLRSIDVEVIVFDDFKDSKSPDSIFPNNWISTHSKGKLFTFPMMVENRRKERRNDIIDHLVHLNNYTHIDLTASENYKEPKILEGTGSMIFDHMSKKIYAAISPRTNLTQLKKFADEIGYSIISFTAYGKQNELIYHTNVMMTIGEGFAVIGSDTIDKNEVDLVKKSLIEDKKELIELTNDQVYNHFAGNMLQITNKKDEKIIVMSENAYSSLSEFQISQLRKYNDKILHVEIPTIERIGGGSARCMLAEIFKPD